MVNSGFLRRGELLDEGPAIMAKAKHVVNIVHGRNDFVCQPLAAHQLNKALVKAGCSVKCEFVAGAGHSDSEPGLVDAMVRATDGFRQTLIEDIGKGRKF